MTPQTITIGNRRIGPGEPVYIVAEMSANHNQDYEQALAIIRAAAEAGADAVKLQTYTPDTLTIKCDQPWFRIGSGTIWEGRTLYDLYEEAATPWEWQPELKREAERLGLALFSSPFDEGAVSFLQQLDVPAYKVASFEIVDHALLRAIARTGKPVIVSTGMATFEEIDEAMRVLKESGAREIALLKCTSAYPARPEEMNLRTIPHLASTFAVPVGLSDHTLGITVPIAAVALGATLIEKHITLSRALPGPDAAFSLEPTEFAEMVRAVRDTEKALGTISYAISEREAKSRIFRRSLFVVKDIQAGETFTEENVRSIRPGYGLHPRELPRVLGKVAARDLKRGTPLAAEDVVAF